MKRYLIIFMIVLAVLGITARAFCYQADVIDINGTKYFPAVKEALKNAKSSIYMVMYFVNFDPKDKKSQVYQLVEELINAHKRGVKVKVILDQNIDFEAWELRSEKWERDVKNDPLFVYLEKQGVEAYYDSLFISTHSKLIIIDEEIVILGSTNWTVSSFQKNWEVSCLIRSKDLAKQILQNFSKITIDYEASILEEERSPSLRLNQEFLINPSLASRMLTARDDTAFDLYLLLLKNFDGNPEGKVDINYKNISQVLGIDRKPTFYIFAKEDILRRALKRLEKKYKLILYKKRPPRSPYVILLDSWNKASSIKPQEAYCSIPDEYWSYDWNKILSFPEKYCYFINLIKSANTYASWWTGYRIGLSKEFNVTIDTLKRGMKGLRRLNIIEIKYPAYPQQGEYIGRGSTHFRLLGLYSPKVLMKEKERLTKLYGKERFKKAENYARIVYKGNDIYVIEDIIKNMGEYGVEEVDGAFRAVLKKAPDNPKRSYGYVIGILKTKAR